VVTGQIDQLNGRNLVVKCYISLELFQTSSFCFDLLETCQSVQFAGLFKGDQATAEEYQNLLDPLLKETRDGRLTVAAVCSPCTVLQ